MTWRTPKGNRFCTGDEAQLLALTVELIVGEIMQAMEIEDESITFGYATLFDRMSFSEQLAAIEVVARHLLTKTEEIPAHTAWNEATLATILGELPVVVDFERDGADFKLPRPAMEIMANEIDCPDDVREDRDFVVDCYQDNFLWDVDYETELSTPEQVAEMMGIDDEYLMKMGPDTDNMAACIKSIDSIVAAARSGRDNPDANHETLED